MRPSIPFLTWIALLSFIGSQAQSLTIQYSYLEHQHGKKLRTKPKAFTQLQQTIEAQWTAQSDGTVKIRATVRKYVLRMREELDGSTFRYRRSEFDSDQPDRNGRLAAYLRRLLNKPFMVHLGKQGEILNEASLSGRSLHRTDDLERALDPNAHVSQSLVMDFKLRVAEVLRPLVQLHGQTSLLQQDTLLFRREEPEKHKDTMAGYIQRKGVFNPTRVDVQLPISMVQIRGGQADTLVVITRDSTGIRLRWTGSAAQSSQNTFLDHTFAVGERIFRQGILRLSPALRVVSRQNKAVRLTWMDTEKEYSTLEEQTEVEWK